MKQKDREEFHHDGECSGYHQKPVNVLVCLRDVVVVGVVVVVVVVGVGWLVGCLASQQHASVS